MSLFRSLACAVCSVPYLFPSISLLHCWKPGCCLSVSLPSRQRRRCDRLFDIDPTLPSRPSTLAPIDTLPICPGLLRRVDTLTPLLDRPACSRFHLVYAASVTPSSSQVTEHTPPTAKARKHWNPGQRTACFVSLESPHCRTRSAETRTLSAVCDCDYVRIRSICDCPSLRTRPLPQRMWSSTAHETTHCLIQHP